MKKVYGLIITISIVMAIFLGYLLGRSDWNFFGMKNNVETEINSEVETLTGESSFETSMSGEYIQPASGNIENTTTEEITVTPNETTHSSESVIDSQSNSEKPYTGFVSVPGYTSKIKTTVFIDGAGYPNYDHYLGSVSFDVVKLVALYDVNGEFSAEVLSKLASQKGLNQDTNGYKIDITDEVIDALKIKNTDAIMHIKNLDLIRRYYNSITLKDFTFAMSLNEGGNYTLNWYKQNYQKVGVSIYNWYGDENFEKIWKENYNYTYKGDNTYYFPVTTMEPIGDGQYITVTVYGVTKQIVNGKLKAISSVLLGTYKEEEGKGAKPVIYLYPTKQTNVSVQLDLNGKFTITYPQIPENNTRNVVAKTDGTLINSSDKKEYSYLFREGEKMKQFSIDEGFVIEKKDYSNFLQSKLSYLGLTPKEYNEFIVYWLPIMNNYPYVMLKFAGKDYTDQAKLTITPKPDSIQRVFMVFKGLQNSTTLPEQRLSPFVRKGFSVIEWGGTEIK